jgi:hypothetical protein
MAARQSEREVHALLSEVFEEQRWPLDALDTSTLKALGTLNFLSQKNVIQSFRWTLLAQHPYPCSARSANALLAAMIWIMTAGGRPWFDA